MSMPPSRTENGGSSQIAQLMRMCISSSVSSSDIERRSALLKGFKSSTILGSAAAQSRSTMRSRPFAVP